MYFSEAVGIENPEDHDWFDPILEVDTQLFVDPFLIFSDEDPQWSQAHDEMMDYFHNAFELLARSGLKRSHQFYKRTLALMEAPEPVEFRLGFAAKSTKGSGNGPGIATLIVEAMAEAINRGLQDIRHFEELGILVEGIGRDRISDITCNLLKPKFIAYTQTVSHSLGVPMQIASVPHSHFDVLRSRWITKEHLLPVDPTTTKPVILLPKRFLRELPTLNSSEWYDFLDSTLREDLNLQISTSVRKQDVIAAARKSPEAIRRWIEGQEGRRPKPYDTDADPKLLVKWQKHALDATGRMPSFEKREITSSADMLAFVHEVIIRFNHWVEHDRGWRLFWKNASNEDSIPEPNMQLLFMGIVQHYCDAMGVLWTEK